MSGTLLDIDLKAMDTQNLEKLAGFDQVSTKHFTQAMRVAVEIGTRKTISDIRGVAEEQRGVMAGEMVGGDITPLAPINPNIAQNRIKGIYEVHGTMDIIGLIGDTSPGQRYLKMAEKGRGPGKHPPAVALQDWAEQVLGVTPGPSRVTKKGKTIRDLSAGRALSHVIAEKGVRGHAMLELVVSAIQRPVDDQFAQALARIAAELGFK